MWATDKSATHRRAFTRIYTPSLVAKKEKEEEQLVGAMDDNYSRPNMRTRSCTSHTQQEFDGEDYYHKSRGQEEGFKPLLEIG